jgi:hypothetical protein
VTDKTNRKRYGEGYTAFQFINRIHAVLRLYSRVFKIKNYSSVTPFFRAMYRELRHDSLPVPSITGIEAPTFKQQVKKIRQYLNLYEEILHVDGYRDVEKFIRRVEAVLSAFTRQKKLDEYMEGEEISMEGS